MLTRFVASTRATPRDPVADDPDTIEDVRAVVRLRGAAGERELVIATELGGGLRVISGDRRRLPQRARAQLAFHDVASGRILDLAADELHVLDLQMLELLPDAPGPNDPLYLYGPMRGPYPAMLDRPVAAVDGQLTVTRADLLGGLIEGVATAFAYAPDHHGSRCIHALLPGERASAIDAGKGIVLALPLAPAWTLDGAVANDLVVAQIFYDVLSALRADLGVAAGAPALPVPSRAALEQQLVAAGWRIEGDEAVRAKRSGLFGSIFGGGERRTLPREATLLELVAEAKAALVQMAGVPTAEALALQRRLPAKPLLSPPSPAIPKPPAAGSAATSAPPSAPARTIPKPPSAASPIPPRPTPARDPSPAPRPRVDTPRSEWMKDFVDAHRSPARPAPRLSAPVRAVAPEAAPAWMRDFAEPADPPAASDDAAADAADPGPPRDWSKDFE